MKNIVQGSSGFLCECRANRFRCIYTFIADFDWETCNNHIRANYPSRRILGHDLLIVRNEHVPLKGCVVVQKFERSSIIYYT